MLPLFIFESKYTDSFENKVSTTGEQFVIEF